MCSVEDKVERDARPVRNPISDPADPVPRRILTVEEEVDVTVLRGRAARGGAEEDDGPDAPDTDEGLDEGLDGLRVLGRVRQRTSRQAESIASKLSRALLETRHSRNYYATPI